ncbi:MAG: PAS domain S-box protein [Acidobacteriota bacterium]|nr:PAS domain S-box protein [Acidobacteriota bacterium]
MKSEETIIEVFGKMPYKPLVEEIVDFAIFHLDTEGRVLSWNRGAEIIFGYGKDEIIGRNGEILFTPEDRAQDVPRLELETARETGRASDTRWHLKKDNSRFFASGVTTAIRDENETLIGYAKIARDETLRKKIEEAHRESEERYRLLAETASDAIISINEKSVILFINRAAERIFGFRTEEMIGQPLSLLMPEYLRHLHQAGLERYMKTGKRHLSWEHVEVPGLHRDGHEFPLELSFGEYIKGGERVFIGIARDITQRKQADAEREQLLEREQQARREATSILERIRDGFISIDREWRYTYINRAGAEMAGLSPEDFIGKTLWEMNPDAVGTKFQSEYERALRENAPVSFTEYLAWADLWLEVNAYPSEAGLSVFFRDVSLKVRLEKERAELLEREKAARFQAEEANRIKDEFLATLSHELRTPLNAILGWAQVLQTQNLDSSQSKKALSTIQRNATAQAQLIDDLLDVSRIITGKLRLDVRPVDLRSVITAATDAARPAAAAREISLQTLFDPRVKLVPGDADRLQQVVWNLLSNAVKFTPHGGSIQVSLEADADDDPHYVEIAVSDTGKGISPEFLPHVFERFRQSDGSMSRRHGGLGLGLAIVRQIVELHGGSVSVESPGEEQGTTFRVRLPVLAAMPESESEIRQARHKYEATVAPDCPPEISGLKVLIVDDEADSLHLIDFVLTSCGAQTTTVGSAAEAFELIQSGRFDVIISDIGMPDEDGFTLMSRIRQLTAERGGAIPAIALTAYAREEDRQQAQRSGFQKHMSKPFEPMELITVVADVAGRLKDSGQK